MVEEAATPHRAVAGESRNQSGQAMGPKGKRTRQRLIAETIALLGTKRLRELRVADIARAAKISPGTFYLYFADVPEVVLAAIEEAARDTSEVVEIAAGDWRGANARDTARQLVAAYISYWDQHHALFRVRNLAAEEGDPRFINARLKSMLPLLKALEHQATAAQRAGTIFSPKNQAAPIMMKIGPVKPMAVMSASGIFGSAANHSISPTVWKAPRRNCPLTCLGR